MNNGKICVSVAAETAAEMIEKIKQAEPYADVIEVRFDALDMSQISDLKSQISRSEFATPLLATFRVKEEGGKSDATPEERLEFWLELGSGFWAADLERDVIDRAKVSSRKIVSFHDFDGIPPNIDATYEGLSSGSDSVKLVGTANDIVDAIPVWHLLAAKRSEDLTPIAMGEAGKWTRILGLAHGAFMAYASLEDAEATAPGQVTAKDLVEVYRAKELDLESKVYGVIGDPVSQSLSPYMQNAAFHASGENAVFMHLLVKDLDAFITRMVRSETREVELNFGGFSVTMPHKQAIMKHLDAIDDVAKAIGAVNTVKIDADGKMTGYNTDAHGFITPLKAKYGDLKDAKVAVFGAGGAARAVVYALKQEGADVTVFARDEAKRALFAEEFGVRHSSISNFESVISNSETKDQSPNTKNQSFDIIVNATPIGMKPPFENDSILSSDQLQDAKLVFDLVTKPFDTPLIAEAKKAGVATIGGLDMLIAQGARQFEIWTGKPGPAELMRESLLARMAE